MLFSAIYQTCAVTLYFSMFVVVCLICWALFLLMLSHLCLRSKMGGVNDSIEHLEQFLLDTKEILHPNNYQVYNILVLSLILLAKHWNKNKCWGDVFSLFLFPVVGSNLAGPYTTPILHRHILSNLYIT